MSPVTGPATDCPRCSNTGSVDALPSQAPGPWDDDLIEQWFAGLFEQPCSCPNQEQLA